MISFWIECLLLLACVVWLKVRLSAVEARLFTAERQLEVVAYALPGIIKTIETGKASSPLDDLPYHEAWGRFKMVFSSFSNHRALVRRVHPKLGAFPELVEMTGVPLEVLKEWDGETTRTWTWAEDPTPAESRKPRAPNSNKPLRPTCQRGFVFSQF